MIFDITPLLSPRTGVWPGDTPLHREMMLEIARGDSVTLSTMRATAHLGAHADAPSHYGLDAPTIELRRLELYVGLCQVVHAPVERGTRVGRDRLPATIEAPRVLIATGTFPDPNVFNRDFAALEPALVRDLAGEGVVLIGIDTPSVDLIDSREIPSHREFLAADMAILEGLVLRDVPEGLYELIALPLKLEGFDASPVRAVLRSRDQGLGIGA
ncbi:MAG: cyclase family protein [Gemmatimonadota bacterium]